MSELQTIASNLPFLKERYSPLTSEQEAQLLSGASGIDHPAKIFKYVLENAERLSCLTELFVRNFTELKFCGTVETIRRVCSMCTNLAEFGPLPDGDSFQVFRPVRTLAPEFDKYAGMERIGPMAFPDIEYAASIATCLHRVASTDEDLLTATVPRSSVLFCSMQERGEVWYVDKADWQPMNVGISELLAAGFRYRQKR